MKAIITGATIALFAAAFSPAPSQGANASVAELFKMKCVMCHGADGSGNTPMGKRLNLSDLRSKQVQEQSDSVLQGVIENGKGKMPAQKARLAKEQIQQLVGYVRELAKKK